MNHIQLSIEATEKDQELLIGLLSLLAATGFEQTDTHLIAYFEEENFASYDVYAVLKNYTYNSSTVPEQNWNAAWEESFQPVVVPQFCAVRAHFHEPILDVPYQIIITPKMSFGTGHHATTYMMLQNMQSLKMAGKKVLDFGTGTGVLAILAEKLGAVSVTAIDNDVWSFENVQENIRLNGCSKIQAQLTEVIPENEIYDVILANITKNVLLSYMEVLKSSLVVGGFLLLSGLLEQDKQDIADATHNWGMKLVQEERKNGWIALLFGN